jgi:hypothetical protein
MRVSWKKSAINPKKNIQENVLRDTRNALKIKVDHAGKMTAASYPTRFAKQYVPKGVAQSTAKEKQWYKVETKITLMKNTSITMLKGLKDKIKRTLKRPSVNPVKLTVFH